MVSSPWCPRIIYPLLTLTKLRLGSRCVNGLDYSSLTIKVRIGAFVGATPSFSPNQILVRERRRREPWRRPDVRAAAGDPQVVAVAHHLRQPRRHRRPPALRFSHVRRVLQQEDLLSGRGTRLDTEVSRVTVHTQFGNMSCVYYT